MKKKLIVFAFVFFAFILLFLIKKVKNENDEVFNADISSDVSYNSAVAIIQETMRAWYMRGSFNQYNTSKNIYNDDKHPEDLTSQDFGYTICTGFTGSVFKEAFGNSFTGDNSYNIEKAPTTTSRYFYQLKDWIQEKNSCKTGIIKDGCNGEYAIFYSNSDDDYHSYYYDTSLASNSSKESLEYYDLNNKLIYQYKNNKLMVDFDDFIEKIHPGDVFVYGNESSTGVFSGHALIAYSVMENPKTNKKDVLLLNSTSGDAAVVKTKLNRPLNYRNLYLGNSYSKSDYNIFSIDYEGTIRPIWLSEVKQFVDNVDNQLYIKCATRKCSVSRFFYEDNGNAKFNYTTNNEQIKNSFVRTKLSGIYIHKISDSMDNNIVYPNQLITYTIKITNNSTEKYNSFYVSENISDKVNFVSSNMNGSYDNENVIWQINSLLPGESIELKYQVMVKDSKEFINQKVESDGKIYIDETGFITTGLVSNTIAKKIDSKYKIKDYQSCYNDFKGSLQGLNLIDQIYKCVYGEEVNLELNEFSNIDENYNLFEELITYSSNKIKLVKNDKTQKYYDMVLNNYWNRNIVRSKDLLFIQWKSSYRANTIYNNHFLDGDVLIFQNENDENIKSEDGIYAFIYIDGKFVGVNYKNQENERVDFSYDYYKNQNYSDLVYIKDHENITFNEKDNINELTFYNLQSLFGKLYYVILRPELIIFDGINFPKLTLMKELECNNYIINNQYVTGFKIGESVNSIKNQLDDSSIIIESNVDIISTGTIIKNENESYVVIIKGDINCDGKIGALDYIAIRNHMLNNNVISDNTKYIASDMNDDNKISALDYIAIKKIMMNNL